MSDITNALMISLISVLRVPLLPAGDPMAGELPTCATFESLGSGLMRITLWHESGGAALEALASKARDSIISAPALPLEDGITITAMTVAGICGHPGEADYADRIEIDVIYDIETSRKAAA